MFKKKNLFVTLFAPTLFLFSQVKIGDNFMELSSHALLELESKEKGLLLPRMTTKDMRNAFDNSAPAGLLVFNTDTQEIQFSYRDQMGNLSWRSSISFNQNTPPAEGQCATLYYDESTQSLSFWDNQTQSYIPLMISTEGSKRIYESGLTTDANQKVRLGGKLLEPTLLETDETNTLSIIGLEEISPDEEHHLLVTDSKTGVLKKVPFHGVMGKRQITKIKAMDGQSKFNTTEPIASYQSLSVYRNGVLVDFTIIDNKTIELEPQAICYENDEVRIVYN
jgi:hypothetical protein